MNNISKHIACGIVALAMSSILSSCNDDDLPTSNVSEIVYPTSVTMTFPDNWKYFVYEDATSTKVLPLQCGQSLSLGYGLPDEATYTDVVWESNNHDVVSVDQSGNLVAGNTAGTALISVHPEIYNPGSGIQAVLKVEVFESVETTTKVSIVSPDRDEYYVGDEIQLTFKIMPENATYRTVKWFSSDPSVGAIDDSGKLRLLKVGDVDVTATSMDGISDVVSFSVKSGVAPSSIDFVNMDELTDLAYGQKLDFKSHVRMTPEDATFSMIKWRDEDNLISVDANGQLSIRFCGDVEQLKMENRTITLIAEDRNGNHIGETTISLAGGHMVYNFEDGYAPLYQKLNGSTVATLNEHSVLFDLSGSGRQDLNLAVNANKAPHGGFFISPAKYKYLAVKIRRPYYLGDDGSISDRKPGGKAPKFALNFNVQKADDSGNDNVGHRTNFSLLDMTTLSTVPNIWDGQAYVYVFDLTSESRISAQMRSNGLVSMRNLDFIIADHNDVNVKSYEIYWFGTFESYDAIKEYYMNHE